MIIIIIIDCSVRAVHIASLPSGCSGQVRVVSLASCPRVVKEDPTAEFLQGPRSFALSGKGHR